MSNSIDARIIQDLVTTLTDGADGYRLAAEKVEYDGLAATFTEYSTQRERFAQRLVDFAGIHGWEIETEGSTLATLHRGWMSVREAVTGTDPSTLVETCLQGEEHALSRYQDALGNEISQGLLTLVEPQFQAIQTTAADLRAHLTPV